MAIILTTPSFSTGPVTSSLLTDHIIAGESKIVDAVDVTKFPNTKWIISITDTVTQQKLTQEVLTSYNSTIIKYSRSSLVGDIIPHLLWVDMNNDDITAQLNVTNNSTHDYTTEISRQFSL